MNLSGQLQQVLGGLVNLQTETSIILGAILLLVSGLLTNSRYILKSIYAATLVVAAVLLFSGFSEGEDLLGAIAVNHVSQSFTFLFLLCLILILLYRREEDHGTEFYFLLLSLGVGSMFIMKSNSFILTFLSIELTSFAAYILTSFSFRTSSFEASVKYLLFGAVASAFMLFGFGMIYAASGSMFWSELSIDIGNQIQFVGLLLVTFGLLFKSSIVPFHIWVPAAYQSAPNDAVAIMSILPKLAAMILLAKISTLLESTLLFEVLLILGMLTIIAGTLAALQQTQVRRMISYGAIAHTGFLLPLALLGTDSQVFWWYACIYAFMNLGVFFLLNEFERKELFELKDYASIGGANSVLAVAVTLVLVSLIGLPPLAGFTAKLLLFTALWDAYLSGLNSMYLTYLIVAVAATLGSLFFYLRVPYQVFLVKGETSGPMAFSLWAKIIATLFSIVVLLLFFAPDILTSMHRLLNSQFYNE